MDWSSITRSLVRFAQEQINRRRWRYLDGGVLPEGFDAESIASEAILQLFTSRNHQRWANAKRLEYRLRGLILRLVNRLYHLKENRVLSSEPDLSRDYDFDGDLISPIELVPDQGVRPDQAAAAHDAVLGQDAQIGRFRRSLGRQRKLRACFELLQDGDVDASNIAARLNLSLPKARKLKARLRRLWNLHITRSSQGHEALIKNDSAHSRKAVPSPRNTDRAKNREFHFAE